MSDEPRDGPEGWLERHGDGLYRLAMLRLRSPDLAADAVQETFLEALRARDSFAGRSSERTWLVGILKHKIADHYRRSARGAESRLGAEPASSDFDRRGHWRAGPASWGDPGRDLEAQRVLGRLRGLPRQAPPGARRRLPAPRARRAQLRGCAARAGDHAREPLGPAPPLAIAPEAMPRIELVRATCALHPPPRRRSERLAPHMTPPGAVWRLLHLPCREASRLSSESLDRDLGGLDRLALRSHLLCCSACRRYRRQIGVLRDAMRRLAAQPSRATTCPAPRSPTTPATGSSAPSGNAEIAPGTVSGFDVVADSPTQTLTPRRPPTRTTQEDPPRCSTETAARRRSAAGAVTFPAGR